MVAGGHCAFNPEPLADFVDCFVLGDGEEVVGEINEVIAARSAGDSARPTAAELLRALARLDGVYVPAATTPPTSRAAGTPPPACPRWLR